MPETRKLLTIGLDCLFILIPLLPIVLIEAFRLPIPVKRGFFCNDQSIQYPYKKETYPTHSLVIIMFVVPLVIVLIVEVKRLKSANLKAILKNAAVFSFGLLTSFALVEFLKFTAGIHRPNFLDYCKPVLPDTSDCKDERNHGKYIEDYTCANEAAYIESRVSFPSAHASISFYIMTYMALYIHSRVTWSESILFKYAIEFSCILYATSISISRVYDYMHSSFDVIFGALIGVLFALWMVFCATSFFKKERIYDNDLAQEQEYKRREEVEFN
ncbi:PPAP2A.2 family protein [Megaselia abdita]